VGALCFDWGIKVVRVSDGCQVVQLVRWYEVDSCDFGDPCEGIAR